ncbi:hypothetical protein ACGF5F_18130 [Streptomyces sp. NPDC047821]|uniref:hypothetical protein n=1 Tax=Streptomyces sp. NPDC047821 TaxID=3365488 RepID=UPI0037213E46
MLLLLEFALHCLMDLALWLFGRTFDKTVAARRVASFRRGEGAVLRCRYRVRAEGPGAMRRGRLTLTRAGAVLDRAGAESLRLTSPGDVATGGGRGGTTVVCEAVGAGTVELLVPTWDPALVKLITDTMAARV